MSPTCHGIYGEKWTYPNKHVPSDVIGTDRNRFDGDAVAFGEAYNKSWFAKDKGWDNGGTPSATTYPNQSAAR